MNVEFVASRCVFICSTLKTLRGFPFPKCVEDTLHLLQMVLRDGISCVRLLELLISQAIEQILVAVFRYILHLNRGKSNVWVYSSWNIK